MEINNSKNVSIWLKFSLLFMNNYIDINAVYIEGK